MTFPTSFPSPLFSHTLPVSPPFLPRSTLLSLLFLLPQSLDPSSVFLQSSFPVSSLISLSSQTSLCSFSCPFHSVLTNTVLEFPISLFSISHFSYPTLILPNVLPAPSPLLTIFPSLCLPIPFLRSTPSSVSLSHTSSLLSLPIPHPPWPHAPLPALSAKAYSPEFYFDTPNPTRSHKLSKNYSYVLQWTQREPDAVDPVLNYRLSVRQVGQGRWGLGAG